MMNSSESFLEYASEMSREYFIECNDKDGYYSTIEELREIYSLIAEIDAIKHNDPNMDIYKFINEKFGEERGGELFEKYLDYIKKDGYYGTTEGLQEIYSLIAEIDAAKQNDPDTGISKFINKKFGEERGEELFEKYLDHIKKDRRHKRTIKGLQKVQNLIAEINTIKQNNPNMDISKFINEKFGEEKGRELFEKYSAYLEIIKNGIDALEQSAENFEKNALNTINGYLKEEDKTMEILQSLRMSKILKMLDEYCLSSEILNEKDIDELIELDGNMNRLVDAFDNSWENINYKMRYDIFNDFKKEQVNKLYEQFTYDERILITALLIAQPGNKEFFEKYRNKYLPKKKSMIDVIGEQCEAYLEKMYLIRNKLEVLRDEEKAKKIETIRKISKFIPVEPNVFIKYLPKTDGNALDKHYSVRQDCCLEFDLKYDQDNNKTILTLFLDTYDYADKTCSNIKRYKLGECSCQGNQPIDSVIKSSRDIQYIINKIHRYNDHETSELLDILREKRIEDIINKQFSYDKYYGKYAEIINYSVNNDSMANGIFEKGIAMINNKIIYFEDFNDNEGKESFRIVENIDFRKPIEEYKNKLNSNKLTDKDKIFLIDKVEKSNELTKTDRSILTDKLKSNSELNEDDKLFLMNKIKLSILTDCQKLKDPLASTRDPQDQEHNSIFDFEEIFGNMTQEDREGRVILPIIPRMQCVAGNEEREKAILKEVTTFHANEETMKSKHLEDIEKASKEIEQSFQTGRVVDKK